MLLSFQLNAICLLRVAARTRIRGTANHRSSPSLPLPALTHAPQPLFHFAGSLVCWFAARLIDIALDINKTRSINWFILTCCCNSATMAIAMAIGMAVALSLTAARRSRCVSRVISVVAWEIVFLRTEFSYFLNKIQAFAWLFFTSLHLLLWLLTFASCLAAA